MPGSDLKITGQISCFDFSVDAEESKQLEQIDLRVFSHKYQNYHQIYSFTFSAFDKKVETHKKLWYFSFLGNKANDKAPIQGVFAVSEFRKTWNLE